MIDWEAIDRVATEPFQPRHGPDRPILRPRLIAGLLYLQCALDFSDEQDLAGRLEPVSCLTYTGNRYGHRQKNRTAVFAASSTNTAEEMVSRPFAGLPSTIF
jgi:hypothetical protein